MQANTSYITFCHAAMAYTLPSAISWILSLLRVVFIPSYPILSLQFTGSLIPSLSLSTPTVPSMADAAESFNREAFTLLGVGTLVVILRTYARWSSVGIGRFMLDDYLMLLAVVRNTAPDEEN